MEYIFCEILQIGKCIFLVYAGYLISLLFLGQFPILSPLLHFSCEDVEQMIFAIMISFWVALLLYQNLL